MRPYGLLSYALSAVIVGLGIAMVAVTIARGGGMLGVVLGTLFVAAGAGRIYVLWGSSRG